MQNFLLILFGKILAFISQALNLGHGSTWPGHIALLVNKKFIQNILKKSNTKIVLIAGTNGKTTTGKLIQTLLEKDGKRVFQNEAGANLLNGIASSLLLHCSIGGKLRYDYAVFEVDENSLPLVLKKLTPDYLILLNIFRDQLDRYGETDVIANKWEKAIKKLPSSTILILNADDPQIAFLGHSVSSKAYYFGLDDKKLHQKTPQHAVDSTYCPNCKHKLQYKTVYFSHLGDWQCNKCGYKRPKLNASFSSVYPLKGVYNRYNTHAATLFGKLNNVNNETIEQSLKEFKPAFGRQEIIELDGKKVQIFLSKNPTSFNESLRTIIEKKAKYILIVLNDRIPDGRDVSWIWDVDLEQINPSMKITISGDRLYDMALRMKYAMQNFPRSGILLRETKFQIEENLKSAIHIALDQTPKSETLYILPTYSAMLEVRKVLTGKSIL